MCRAFLSLAICLAVAAPIVAQQPLTKNWTTSKITGSPQPPSPFVSERIFPSLSFNEPCELVAVPGTNRMLVIEVKGKLYTFENKPADENLQPELFADVTQLDPQFFRVYGIAFHPKFGDPKFPDQRYCYISYVLNGRTPQGTRVSRFKVTDADPPTIDLTSEQIIITWLGGGHNGGHLQFGPDGMLYISTGDGGESFPADGNNTGQDISDLLASILRIDVDRTDGYKLYRIPADNPFVGQAKARGEVWAYGLRNPWKMCFNPADGSLWVGDVGWELWEMIYRVERGGNYGWSLTEGKQPVHRERARGPSPILPPTVEHDHTEARSITGGYFSQTGRLPELRDTYIYGDYVTGKIWGVKWAEGAVTKKEELVDTTLAIVSFGLDQNGDVLILDYGGTLHRLKENPRRNQNANFPTKLSETGLFADVKNDMPATGVIPYEINAEPWADGTTAKRFVALPGGAQLTTYEKTDVQVGLIKGEFQFPTDGVLAKTIYLETEKGKPSSRRRVETQVLHYDVDTWKAYNYIWNDEQTDATLAPDVSSDRAFSIKDAQAEGGQRQQTWHHASRTECILCHTTRAASIHGFRYPQLKNLSSLTSLEIFAEPPPEKIDTYPAIDDQSKTLDQRARAYLHINCAHCHRRGGGGSASFDVQYEIPFDKTRLVTRPTQGTFNLPAAHVVTPGDPYRSVLYYRMAKLGHGRMPQFGSQVVDTVGLKLIHDWIASLPPEKGVTNPPPLPTSPDLNVPVQALQVISQPAVSKNLIDAGIAHQDPLIRDLFERYIPEEKRAKRLGTSVQSADILALKGDAVRGRDLFANSKGVQCRNCHRIGDIGKAVGPDLTQVGKKLDRAKLIESILEPSKTIDPQYATHLIETTDGRVISGLLVRKTVLVTTLKTADGNEVTVPNREIEQAVTQQRSLMPELLLQEMTAPQVADLLEYLQSLK
ncbi:PQQ-dependent sugar dehydrogenase [Anatilimnocola floriformis]|uniref:PQQ-dependent sugar dehydrogenase n=1 Tax=Anatilimnocola floriformis TaxID=2948575 RepID=UPI0020C541F9|nr:PQQ-dependent sugar dehydrogenase [Anatilimnocola floriformis]